MIYSKATSLSVGAAVREGLEMDYKKVIRYM